VSVSKDFAELLGLLSSHGVRALLVGGHALAFHAKPRYTKDFDLWIERSSDNVERLLRALDEFGFGSLGLKPEDLLTPGQFVQLGYPPNRIDLLNALPGLDFEEAWERRVDDVYGGQKVAYLSREDLIRNKEAVGRPQDLVDVQLLRFWEKGAPDG
jgi:hypothetical protein